jgi:hypothetical protein
MALWRRRQRHDPRRRRNDVCRRGGGRLAGYGHDGGGALDLTGASADIGATNRSHERRQPDDHQGRSRLIKGDLMSGNIFTNSSP